MAEYESLRALVRTNAEQASAVLRAERAAEVLARPEPSASAARLTLQVQHT